MWHYAGRDYRLCLTLGALAELEHHFEANGIAELSERLARGSLSSTDIIALLAAGLRGAGEEFDPTSLHTIPIADLFPNALTAIAGMIDAAFGATETMEKSRVPFPGRL